MPKTLSDSISINDTTGFERLYRQGVRLKDEHREEELRGRNELHYAIWSDANDIVRNIVTNFPELINIPDRYFRSPLHYAYYFGKQEMVDLLLKSGATVAAETPELFLKVLAGDLSFFPERNEFAREAKWFVRKYHAIKDASGASLLHYLAASPVFKFRVICKHFPLEADAFGWTPLHAAVHANQEATAFAIISNEEADVEVLNRLDVYGFAALHYSAQRNQAKAIRSMIRAGANPNIRSDSSSTPLHEAAWKDAADAIFSLHQNGALTEVVNGLGMTPLLFAVVLNNQLAAAALYDCGAKNSPCGPLGFSPFRMARLKNLDTNRAVFESIDRNNFFLLAALMHDESSPFESAKFDETRCNDNGYPPLLWALAVGDLKCINILFSAVNDLSIRTACGKGAFQVIAERTHYPDHCNFQLHLCRRFADAGLEVDIPGRTGRNALTTAVYGDSFSLAAYLISLGAEINLESNAPLESVQSVEMLSMLAGFGADMFSQSAANLACEQSRKGNLEMVDYLIHRWAHLLNMPGRRGRTPLEEAIRSKELDVVQLLSVANEELDSKDKLKSPSADRLSDGF